MPVAPAARTVRRDPLATACSVAIPLLVVGAPVVTLILVWWAFGLTFHLAGGTPPTDAEQQRAGWLALAAAAAVGLPVLGFVLAVRAGTRPGMWTFALMGAVGLAVAAVLTVGVALPALRDATPSPQPSSTRSVCQEHSGGDNRCPGG